MKPLCAAFVLAFSASDYARGQAAASSPPSAARRYTEVVTILDRSRDHLYQGDQSQQWEPIRRVIRDSISFAQLLSTAGVDDQDRILRKADFRSSVIVVAGLGRLPSMARQVVIDELRQHGDAMTAVVTFVDIDRDRCTLLHPAQTAPLDIVRIPKTKRTIVFEERTVVSRDCGRTLPAAPPSSATRRHTEVVTILDRSRDHLYQSMQTRQWEPIREVIRDSSRFAQFLVAAGLDEDDRILHKANFQTSMIIVAGLGRRGYMGEQVIMDEMRQHGDTLRILVTYVDVDKRCPGHPLVTAPLDIVRIPKMTRTVVFEERTVLSRDCGLSLPKAGPRPK